MDTVNIHFKVCRCVYRIDVTEYGEILIWDIITVNIFHSL